ncbi:MAG TPA: hypothetical protein VEM96_03300 [Pyrinomonadaceae bacterium]|nr:hypothetical protein [Pyrinomonadaceae bacterium]
MNARESLLDVENLRFRVQMNNRLRLECLAAVSKVFREFGEPMKDELLSSIVFALPQELISSNGHGFARVELEMAQPGNPPGKPEKEKPEREKPGLPPGHPKPESPGLPPPEPGLPPSEPDDEPALPPNQPEQDEPQYVA